MTFSPLTPELVVAFEGIVGPAHVLTAQRTEALQYETYGRDHTEDFHFAPDVVLRHFWELFTGGDIAYAPDPLRIPLRTDPYRHYRATAVATLDHDRPLLQTALHELSRLSALGPFTGPLVWTPIEPTPLYADEDVRLLMSQPGPPEVSAAAPF